MLTRLQKLTKLLGCLYTVRLYVILNISKTDLSFANNPKSAIIILPSFMLISIISF